MGNFTVNSYSGIRVEPTAVKVNVVIDAAEVPTLQALPPTRGGLSRTDAAAYRERTCGAVVDGTQLALHGRPVPLAVVNSTLEFPPARRGYRPCVWRELHGDASTVGTRRRGPA